MPTATAEPRATEQLAETLRGRVAAIAPDHADLVIAALVEAMQTTKRTKGRCDTCDAWVSVSVQDSGTVVRAIDLFMTQAEGRPATADTDQGTSLAIQRGIATTTAPDELLALLDAGDHETLRNVLLEAANAEREG